ncbi:MAG: NAD-binding protein, partial [Limibacillus sp.]
HLEAAKALITTLPVDAHNLFVVLTVREINPGLAIISRASDEQSDVKLKRAGATNVIMPDKIGGKRMAKLVAQPDIVEFVDYIMLQSAENVVLEELEHAKTYLTGSFPLRFSNSPRIAGMLVGMQQENLGIDYLDSRNAYIEAVTLEDAKRVAAELFQPDKLTVVVVGKPQDVEATRAAPEEAGPAPRG